MFFVKWENVFNELSVRTCITQMTVYLIWFSNDIYQLFALFFYGRTANSGSIHGSGYKVSLGKILKTQIAPNGSSIHVSMVKHGLFNQNHDLCTTLTEIQHKAPCNR